MRMNKTTLGLAVAVACAAVAVPVQALMCPQLVKDCTALIAKVEGRGGDAAKLAEAKEYCQKAQTLHEQGKHVDSVIAAGEAIEEAGEAAK